jgi:hypothetical protein
VSKRLIALIFGALAIGLIAGCGSGSDNSSSLTKAEFIKQADAVCTKHHDQIIDDFDAFSKTHNFSTDKSAKSFEVAAEFSKIKVIPTLKVEAKELKALGVPDGDGGAVGAILKLFEEGIEEAEAASPKEATTSPQGLTKGNELAKKFGFKTCLTS